MQQPYLFCRRKGKGMNFIVTDGENKDFVMLCRMLDDNLNELVGGEKQREQYNRFNTLDKIHDVIVLYDGDKPIGCAAFKYFDEGIAEMKRVFLHKEYRGKGYAKELIRRLEELAKSKGYRALILETGKPLTAAIGLYNGLGYQIIENYGQYKDLPLSVCMKKDIY